MASAVYGATAVCVNDNFSDKLCVSKPKTLSPWLKQLGGNIRRERNAKGMSQQQLAEFADLNIRNVQRIEAGEIDLLLTTAVRIRKALACPLERLIPKDS
jgi:DNA-binding XRE family transcriptional regulator